MRRTRTASGQIQDRSHTQRLRALQHEYSSQGTTAGRPRSDKRGYISQGITPHNNGVFVVGVACTASLRRSTKGEGSTSLCRSAPRADAPIPSNNPTHDNTKALGAEYRAALLLVLFLNVKLAAGALSIPASDPMGALLYSGSMTRGTLTKAT